MGFYSLHKTYGYSKAQSIIELTQGVVYSPEFIYPDLNRSFQVEGEGFDLSANSHMRISPNPTQSRVVVSFTAPDAVGKILLKVYDIRGKEIELMQVQSNIGTVEFNLANLNSGIYNVVMFWDGIQIETQKVQLIK